MIFAGGLYWKTAETISYYFICCAQDRCWRPLGALIHLFLVSKFSHCSWARSHPHTCGRVQSLDTRQPHPAQDGAGGGGEEERTVGRKLQIVLGLLSPVLIAVLGVAPSVDSE